MKIKKIDKNTVTKISKLAYLPVSKNETVKFQKQLTDILNYVKILNELDTGEIKPTSQVTGLINVTRKDKPRKSLSQEEALSGTASKHNGYFKIKSIF